MTRRTAAISALVKSVPLVESIFKMCQRAQQWRVFLIFREHFPNVKRSRVAEGKNTSVLSTDVTFTNLSGLERFQSVLIRSSCAKISVPTCETSFLCKL